MHSHINQYPSPHVHEQTYFKGTFYLSLSLCLSVWSVSVCLCVCVSLSLSLTQQYLDHLLALSELLGEVLCLLNAALIKLSVRLRCVAHVVRGCTTRFTGFTSTKVQRLTPGLRRRHGSVQRPRAAPDQG